MDPRILDNPPRPIYPKSVENLLTNLVSRHASSRAVDDPLGEDARILDDPLARHPAWHVLHVWDTMAYLLKPRRHSARPFALLLFDIDHFKRFNDTLGHLRGDDVIRKVAEIATATLRDTDMVCRWDGEEFIVLARQYELHDACELAEKLRATVAAKAIFQPDDGTRATISIGVTAHRSGDTIDAMVARVDKALYRAKREGRNCVRVANEHDAWSDLVAAE